MTDAHIAHQIAHMARMEYITDLAIVLTQVQLVTVAHDNTCRVLASVLQHQ